MLISKFGVVNTPPYICVMDKKQLTKIIKKGLGKKVFPFEYDTMKGTIRFVSVEGLGYNFGEGVIPWARINVEVDIIEDSRMCINFKEWGRSQNIISRRRNVDIHWSYSQTTLYTMMRFFNINHTKIAKITYKKKPNDLRKHPHINLNQETNKENC